MDDLVTWLRAQLGDDERVARKADHDDPAPWDRKVDLIDVAKHIARWDPARVLAEVDAKRRTLELHGPGPTNYVDGMYEPGEPAGLRCEHCAGLCHSTSGIFCESPDAPWPCPTVRLLALPYADRPGYREQWRPSEPA